MTIEFIGMIHHRHASEIHPPAGPLFDRGYVRDFAQAAEAATFDRVLVGYFSDGPDGFLLAAAAGAHTERLGFLVAHRPGFVAPTLAARKFATLDQVTGGRAAIHVISGGDDADQLRDGDTLPKDERYARTDEYVHILKRIWTEQGTVDHAGRYYQFTGASTAMRCVQQPRIPIYFGGASDAAIEVAGKHADVYALWGETHEQVRELTTRSGSACRCARSWHRPKTQRGNVRKASSSGLPNCVPTPVLVRANRRTKVPAGSWPRPPRANDWTSACGLVPRC
jgi:alkanesulfonate monooxygenase